MEEIKKIQKDRQALMDMIEYATKHENYSIKLDGKACKLIYDFIGDLLYEIQNSKIEYEKLEKQIDLIAERLTTDTHGKKFIIQYYKELSEEEKEV